MLAAHKTRIELVLRGRDFAFSLMAMCLVMTSCGSGDRSTTPTGPGPSDAPGITTIAPATGSSLLRNADGQSKRWAGVGRIYGSSTCTATFIATSADASSPAFVVTNGHCIEWNANGAIIDADSSGEVIFNYFVDTQETQIEITYSNVTYSTMQSRDIAIIQLDATVGDLTAQGLQPFELADEALSADGTATVVGAPDSGVDEGQAFLRSEQCTLAGRADLIEFQWHFDDAYRTDCQDIFGGSSGSPLFSEAGDIVYALINTTVEPGTACSLGVPCEVEEAGARTHPGHSYATPIDGLGNCFVAGRFDLTAACPLPPIEQFELDGVPAPSQPPTEWNTALSGPLSFYRYKVGEVGAVDCRSDDGYSSPIRLAEVPIIDDALGAADGFYQLCVLGGPTQKVDSSWQSLTFPTVAIAEIDTTPPIGDIELSIQEYPDVYAVQPLFAVPEYSNFSLKFGPVDVTDCEDRSGYEFFRRIPIDIPRDQGPMRLCSIGYDHAGNASPALDTVFD